MSEHTQADTGLTDDAVDVSKGTQTQGAMAENELFVEHLLGIRIPHHIDNIEQTADMLAEQVTYRILSGVDQTRTHLVRADLRDLLDERITHALEGARVAHHRHHRPGQTWQDWWAGGQEAHVTAGHREERLRETRAIADAIRESIPEDVIDDLVRNEMTVALDVAHDVPKHFVQMHVDIGGTLRDVRIDMRNSFWRDRSFVDAVALATELTGKVIGELGITISPSNLPSSYRLSPADAGHITAPAINVISPKNTYTALREGVEMGGETHDFYVNVRALVAATLDDFPDLAEHKYVGNLNRAQLREYLLHLPNMGQNFTYWNRWVHGLGNNPMEDVTPVGGAPLPAIDHVLNRIFASVGAPGPQLATSPADIFTIQKEINQQHLLDVRLKEGSDNKVGAALATIIASQHPDVRTVVAGRDRATVENDLNTAAANRQLLQMLEVLEATPLPTGVMTYGNLETRLTNIESTIGTVASTTPPTPVTILGGGGAVDTMNIPLNARGAADYGPVYTWIYQKKKDTEEELKAFRNIEARLAPIADFCTRNAITGTGIQTIIDNCRATPRNPNDISQTMDLKGLADGIRVLRNLNGKTKADLDKDVERLQNELKDVISGKATGPHGDAAQHLVLKEYLKKYRGLSESDANAATNYMRARSKLDSDLADASDDIVSGVYGHERLNSLSDWLTNVPNVSLSAENRSKRIVYQIGYASHVPMKPNTYNRSILRPGYYTRLSPEPNWSQATYSSLMESYFAMKKLYDGHGPARLKLQQTNYVQKQMREISRALLSKHSQSLLKDFGPSLGLTDEKQKEILKEPTKAEHVAQLQQTLEGDAPAAYAHKVDHVIGFANQHTDWLRHTFLTNEKYGILYGKQNWFSGRSLAYGNKYMSVAGLGYRAPKAVIEGTANIAKKAWARRWSIAAGAAIGTLFLPGVGTAIGASIGAGKASSATTASADHDAHGHDSPSAH